MRLFVKLIFGDDMMSPFVSGTVIATLLLPLRCIRVQLGALEGNTGSARNDVSA